MSDKLKGKLIVKKLYKLFKTFYKGTDVNIKITCLYFRWTFKPDYACIIYKYKFHIIINDDLYVYDGWCYEDELKQIALGIFSHWLLDNYKIYDGESTAWYNMYTGLGNLQHK